MPHRSTTSSRLLGISSLALLASACGGGGSSAPPTPSAVDTGRSEVRVANATALPSDGVAAADLTVVVRGPDGAPVPDREITATSTVGDDRFWPAASARTDGRGEATFRLSATSPGTRAVRVLVGTAPAGAPLVLAEQPQIEFVPPAWPRARVSVSSAGAEADDFSGHAAISGDGRVVGFMSKASNLVPGDTNQKEDVFVHDLRTGVTERVSLTPTDAQFTDLSGRPSLSDDGSLVAFQGRESDDDAVFLRHRAGSFTQPISDATSLGGRCFDPVLSGDGRFVAFVCNDGESQQVYVFDRVTTAWELVSKSSTGQAGDDPSHAPSISRDGRWVAFASTADNLVAGDSNEKDDVFVHDRRTGTTVRVSLSAAGAEGDDDSMEPAIAADGRFVAFASKAENLVAGDDNGKVDVFVHDMQTGTVERVSVDPQGAEVDKESWQPALSADGRYVVFSSLSDDLVDGDRNGKEDVFRRDLGTGVTVRVSLGLGGGDPDEFSTGAALASDAALVAFTSKAQNLVPDDENDKEDVFTAPRDR